MQKLTINQPESKSWLQLQHMAIVIKPLLNNVSCVANTGTIAKLVMGISLSVRLEPKTDC